MEGDLEAVVTSTKHEYGDLHLGQISAQPISLKLSRDDWGIWTLS